MRVCHAILHYLAEQGVDKIFTISSNTIAPLLDATLDQTKIQMIHCQHETMAAFIAAGYARATNHLAVVAVGSGPGLTNIITGVTSAYCEGIPLLILGGEVSRQSFGRGALQEGSAYELSILSMFRTITKYQAEIVNANSALSIVRKAYNTATSGRKRPVLVTVPVDIALHEIGIVADGGAFSYAPSLDKNTIHSVMLKISDAQRPLILAGSGVRISGAASVLKDFVERYHIPTATTMKAKGVFPESHALSLGVYGHGGSNLVKEYLKSGIDYLIAIGCGLGDVTTNNWNEELKPQKLFVQIDIDGEKVGRNFPAHISIIGDARHVLLELIDYQPTTTCSYNHLVERSRYIHSLKTEHQEISRHPEPQESDEFLKPHEIIRRLQKAFPLPTIFVTDIGEHHVFTMHYLTIDLPDSFVINTGFGSMCSGIGMSIGTQLAHRSSRQVVCICGDGGMLMNGTEISTCVKYEIPIVFAVFNDGRLNMVYHGHTADFGRCPDFEKPKTDFAMFAQSLGAEGISITSYKQISSDLYERIRSLKKPVVLDIPIDKSIRFGRSPRHRVQ